MKNDEQNLIAEAKHNLETAKQQLEEFGSNENVDQTTKDLLQRNYENAQVNLKVVTKMANVKEEANKEDAQEAVKMAQSAVTAAKDPQPKPIRKDTSMDNLVLPNQTNGNDITIHFPSSDEMKSAVSYSNAKRKAIIVPGPEDKSAEPAAKKPVKKVSTREALREAAKQTFVGGSKKSAKKSANNSKKTTANDESGMTREEYRKRHNK